MLFVVAGWTVGLRSLSDNSFFTHLATGRLILDSGVPTSDPYSFTAAGEPWTVQSWLVSGAWAAIERAGGLIGLRISLAALTAILGGLVWTLTRSCRPIVGRILLSGAAFGIGAWMWSARPLLVGLILLGVVLLATEGFVHPAWVVPAMWVWTNAHGSFPLGLAAVVLLAVGRLIDDRSRPKVELTVLAYALAGTALGLIGPGGIDRFVFPVRLLTRGDQLRLLVEWQSPSLSDGWTRLFAIQVVAAVVILGRRRSWRAILPSVVFVGLAISAQRNIPAASMVLLPLTAAAVGEAGRLRSDDVTPLSKVVLAAAGIIAVFITAQRLRAPDLDLETYPVDAISWLADQPGRSGNVVTDETTGNLLTLLDEPDWPVALDDRIDMYPPDVVDEYLELLYAEEGWEGVLDAWDADAVIWESGRRLTPELAASPEWRIGYDDGQWIVACRRGSAGCGGDAPA